MRTVNTCKILCSTKLHWELIEIKTNVTRLISLLSFFLSLKPAIVVIIDRSSYLENCCTKIFERRNAPPTLSTPCADRFAAAGQESFDAALFAGGRLWENPPPNHFLTRPSTAVSMMMFLASCKSRPLLALFFSNPTSKMEARKHAWENIYLLGRLYANVDIP